jgi:hypothetical protein
MVLLFGEAEMKMPPDMKGDRRKRLIIKFKQSLIL